MTITSFGDSIMKGVIMDYNPANGMPQYHVAEQPLTDIVARATGAEVSNHGIFGCTISKGEKMLERFMPEVRQSDMTLLEFGGNDSDHSWPEIASEPEGTHGARTPIDRFCEGYRHIIRMVQEAGSTPILMTLPPIDPERYFRFFTRGMESSEAGNIRQWLHDNVQYIATWHEIYNLQLFQLAAVSGARIVDITTPFICRYDYASLLCDDGIHPTAEGQHLIAQTVIDAVR